MPGKINIQKTFTFKGHNAAIYCLCHGTTENTFISGSGDKYIAEWNFLTGEQNKFSAKLPSPVFCLLPLYHLGQLWVGTGNGHLHVIDIHKKEEIHTFRFHKAQIFDLKYSEKTTLVYSSGGDGVINVYDPVELKHTALSKISDKKIRSIEFYKDDLLLAEGSGKTIVLNASTLQLKHEFISHKLATNCYLPVESSSLLYSGGRDAHLNLWDVKNNFHLIKSVPAHNFAIYKILQLNPHEIVATASRDKTIKLWDLNSLQVIERINREKFDGHAFSVNAILWNEEQSTLISGGDDKLIMSWKIQS
jgi:WD40 repeat protein